MRASLVTDPEDYDWSSDHSHVGEAPMNRLAQPDEYRRLSDNSDARAFDHRGLVKQPLAAYDLEAIRAHLNKDCAPGSNKFQEQIEAKAGATRRDCFPGAAKETEVWRRKVT